MVMNSASVSTCTAVVASGLWVCWCLGAGDRKAITASGASTIDAVLADIGPRCREPRGLDVCVSAVGTPRTTAARRRTLARVRQDSVRRPQS